MRYLDGQIAMLGDEVDLGGGMTGTIVACFDEWQFTPDFPESKWGELKVGILVNSEQAGVIHYAEPNVDIALIRRH